MSVPRRARLLVRTTTAACLATALGSVGTLVTASPSQADAASVAVQQAYAVPASGAIPVTGKGYGHGRGMSQYGARGAARQGLGHQQILAFYYPGTTLGQADGDIRVRITADTDGDTRVPVQSGLKVREISSGAVRTLPGRLKGKRVTSWRLRTTARGTALQGLAGKKWRPRATFGGAGAFVRDGAPVVLRLPSGDRSYRGSLRHVSGSTVNVVPLDDLVRGVVAREMPASWEPAALRTQAVAARTYALFEREANARRAWDTCDTTACQVYGGLTSEDARGNDAVAATAGQVLRYAGKAAFTQFSSSSGGWTSKGSQPYLVDQEDPYDAPSGNPNNPWRTTLTRAQVEAAYPSLGGLQQVVVTQRNGHGDWQGRVEKLTLDGARADVVVTGATFRSRFGLKSDWFTFG